MARRLVALPSNAMKLGAVLVILTGIAVFVLLLGFIYTNKFANPRVVDELLREPHGDRAAKVMLITLPSGRQLPVNYLREDRMVYAGADGRWWKELVGDGVEVEVWIRGETSRGMARAVEDDPDYTRETFGRLRPKALPGFGTLVEIRLESPATGG